MSGRRQAATTAVLLGLIPMINLLSASVVALVTLRKGPQEGLLVMLWALLPAALHWVSGDPTITFAVIAMLPLGLVLRRSGSWPEVLAVIMAVAIGMQMSLALQPGFVASIEQGMAQVLDVMQQQGSTPQLMQDGQMVPVTARQLSDLLLNYYGAYHALVFVGALMVARFYQAMLYNPGGFQAEFHGLRLDRRMALVLFGLVVAGLWGAPALENWVAILCIAPALGGLAVAHAMVAQRKAGSGWLVLAYLALVFTPPVVVLLGFADSVVDFRRRYKR